MQQKGTYNPRERYDNDPAVKEVMDALASDRFCPNEHGLFRWIFDELVHRGDRYYHIADFPSYVETQKRIAEEYRQDEIWCRKAVLNVARIGKFSSDRTVLEYARDIWHIGPYEKSASSVKAAGKPQTLLLPRLPVVNGEAIPVVELAPEAGHNPVSE